MPPLPLSPIVPDSSDDSVTANMGSSREESIISLEGVVIGPPVGDVFPGSDGCCNPGGLTVSHC